MIGMSEEELINKLESMPSETVIKSIAQIILENNARLEEDIKKMLEESRTVVFG